MPSWMKRGVASAATLAVLGLAACAGSAPKAVSEADQARAREALEPFKAELLAELVVGLEDGPEHAIAVCRVRAPEIAEGLSGEGVRMGRTSHRVRNPDNGPAPWMEPMLEHYLQNPEDRLPRATYLADDRIGYVEPIYVKPQCVICHGPAVSEELLEQIQALYPDDQATGFAADDFRGLFWVTLPAG